MLCMGHLTLISLTFDSKLLRRAVLTRLCCGQVTALQEERNSLLAENDVLTDRANQLDTFDDPSTPSGKKHSQLQLQFEALQEENFRCVYLHVAKISSRKKLWNYKFIYLFIYFRLEAAKDDYRIHCEELEKQLIELQHRNDELTSLAEESRALKDELDVLRSTLLPCSCSKRITSVRLWTPEHRLKMHPFQELLGSGGDAWGLGRDVQA